MPHIRRRRRSSRDSSSHEETSHGLRRRRRLRKLVPSYLEENIPVTDPAVVNARLNMISSLWLVPTLCVLITILPLFLFGQTVHFDFVNYGDDVAVYANQTVSHGISVSGIFRAFFQFTDHLYTPLATLSHMLDYQFFGLSAWGHHLTNILIHAASTLLLFLALKRMTSALWSSVFVAALFAIHPLQVETVAWVAERRDLLGGLFFMLTVSAYIRYAASPSLGKYISVIVLFALGLLSTPMLVGLPFVLLLLDYWPLSRLAEWKMDENRYRFEDSPDFVPLAIRYLIEKAPMFGLSFLACVITITAQLGNPTGETLPLYVRILNAPVSWMAGVVHAFLPIGLMAFYPHSAEPRPFLLSVVAAIVLAALCLGAWIVRKRHPYLLAGLLWHLAMLAPVAFIISSSHASQADHYSYLPIIGLFILGVWFVESLTVSIPYHQFVLGGAAALLLITSFAVSDIQSNRWRDSETLWTHVQERYPDNYFIETKLGSSFAQKGALDEAYSHYKRALELRPDSAEAEYDFGSVLAQQASLDEAIGHYENALALRPEYPEAQLNLGDAYLQSGDADSAIEHYRKALELRPDYPQAEIALGNALVQKGGADQAVTQFNGILKNHPEDAEAEYNLGLALVAKGDLDGAANHYRQALKIRPDYPQVMLHLGTLLFQQGLADDAISLWRKALILKPDYEEVHYNLGVALVQKGQIDEAISHYQRALEIGPDYAEIYTNLGNAYVKEGMNTLARESFEKAISSDPNNPIAISDLAWLLATVADPNARDGKKALVLATQANQYSGGKNPFVLRTLAAAYAESGKYQEAVSVAKLALSLCDPKQYAALTEQLRHELAIYQSGAAYHESP